MTELVFLKYDGQTVDDLVALEGTHRIDSLVSAFDQALSKKARRVGLDSLTDEEYTVVAVETLQQQVMNGGYWQFVSNPSLEFAADIVEALKRIGCPVSAEITQRALDAMRLPDLTVDAVMDAMETNDPDRDRIIAECNEQFFDYPEDISGRLFDFIKANQSTITF